MTYAQKRAEQILEATVPPAMTWSCEEVAQWIDNLGFPQYKDCFSSNFVDGRKLIFIDQSSMPKIGITDFEDMKVISKAIQDILRIEEQDWTRSISRPSRDAIATFLLHKSKTGKKSDALSYVHFLKTNRKYFGNSPV